MSLDCTLPTLYLCDINSTLTDAWFEVFDEYARVEVHNADITTIKADAVVSPANSFGILDGGIDRILRDALPGTLQRAVHRHLCAEHHGELPVGSATILPTGGALWPYLVLAPTMRIPEPVHTSTHAYLAMRAALLETLRWNQHHTTSPIASLVVPGLATGIGRMPPRRCAAQMKMAYDHVANPARIPSFAFIHTAHRAMKSAL